MKITVLALIVFVVTGCAKDNLQSPDGATGLNLDFETGTSSNTPQRWEVSKDTNYDLFLDSTTAFSGKRSLCINHIGNATLYGGCRVSIPAEQLLGKNITMVGHIRTASVDEGYAGLSIQVDGPGKDGILAYEDMEHRGVRGTTEWKQHKVDIHVDSTATRINFGIDHTGTGTAWFDKLEILADDKPFTYLPFIPTDEQVAWLAKHAKPFSTPLAGSSFEDLASVKDIIGNVDIIGLGEATHGTKEFFQMKHRLIEYLASHHKHLIFTIEANMPEAYKINAYVLGGAGNVRELLAGMYFWIWNTKEVETLIEWMRTYNMSGKGRIEFTGFDMQSDPVASSNVVAFLQKHDKKYAAAIDAVYQKISKQLIEIQTQETDRRDVPALRSEALRILTLLQTNDYTKTATPTEIDWAIQNANVTLQAVNVSTMQNMTEAFAYRDSCMAWNINWIKDHSPANAKIVTWAHNGHIRNDHDKSMGNHLKKLFGKKYCAIGFKFHEGTYTAWSDGELSSSNKATPSYPGSIDWIFHSLKLPRFILDLQGSSPTDPKTDWLYKRLETKSIGPAATGVYSSEMVAEAYDALIFFDQTSASDCYGLTY